MRNLILLLLAITCLGTATLIYFGEQPRKELWATYSTIDAKPSVEIIP